MDRIRRKASNRFKFQSFAERISNINIDVFHRIPHRYEEEDEIRTTYFYETVQKWCSLNLTENFKLFKQEVGFEISTLPQLINHKEKIVSVFLKHIKLQNVLSLQPVLEMLVAFVKDIRHEFYPFYPEILKELILLLKVKDADILESTFTCLAYIFKYLTRELVKDLDKVLLDLAPLLNDENPAYVRDFAAQSFAFVARKVKDKDKFLLLILQTIQNSPHLLHGSSQLIFHMLCGIKGQSHSCAEELFFTIFNAFGNGAIPQKLLFLLAENIVKSYGNAIAAQHSVFFPVHNKVLKEKIEKDGNLSISVKQLLKIMKTGLQCRSGANLQESLIPDVAASIIKLLSSPNEKIRKICVEICGDILILDRVKLPQEISSLIIIKVLATKEEALLLDFMEKVMNFSGFETLVLPQALQIFCSMKSQEFLRTLTKIISSKTESQTKNYNVLELPIYGISLRVSTVKLKEILIDLMEKFDPSVDSTDYVLYAMIIVRHITPTDEKVICNVLLKVISKLVNSINDGNDETGKHLFLLCSALESLLYFRDSVQSECINNAAIFNDILKLKVENRSILVLRIVNLVLTIVEDIKISDDQFSELYRSVEEMTQSPHSYARFLALHSLQCLEKLKPVCEEQTGKSMVDILELCIGAETIPLTIGDYREKIKELQKLKYESLPTLTDDNYQVVVKFLLGVLYCNFQLLWDPVSEVLATFASKMPKSFWPTFYRQLCYVTEICKEKKFPDNYNLPDMDDFVIQNVRFVKVDDKADYNNYRYLLWKSMTLFVDLCESKNRDVVSMYLTFLNEELLKISPQHNVTINIKLNEAVEEDDEEKAESAEKEAVKRGSSSVIKWAVAHLTLLSNFKSPKLCHRESELRNSYYDLLEHKNSEVQKLALECLFTYKFKYMMPYKQNLRNLIDDVKFRDEVVHFQIDKESGVIKDDHREELMPVVMRILYTKMVSRTATKRGSKGSAAMLKRSVVFRFLAGCSDTEMEVFLRMAFRSFQNYQDGDSAAFTKVMSSVDLEHVTPPKKLLSVVSLADVIIEHFGGLMTVNIQRYILKILFSVGAVTSGIFAQRDKVFTGYIASIKNLRNELTDCLAKFFDRLCYPWSDDEVNSIFEIFIWNGLEKLPTEGIYNPTAILRLFSTWSENPRYFRLLVRHKSNDKSVSPLPYVMDLLLNEKTSNSVTSCIVGIVENLLTLKEDENEGNDDAHLEIGNLMEMDESQIDKLALKEELNYGSKILLPHVGSLLTYLRRKLEKSSYALPKAELSILSRITELATSPENADALMTILLRLLTGRKPTDEDTLMNLMTTVENLTKIVKKPLSYLKSFAELLGCLESLESRRALIGSLVNIQSRCVEVEECVTVIRDLNAFDSKWLSQPDFDKRLDGYKKVKELAVSGNMDLNFGLMVLHNCFYVVRYDTDLSLRDSASHCLREICPILSTHWKENETQNQQWIDNILRVIHRGIIGRDENVQSFAVSLLGVMARECSDLHPVLRDLSVYSSKDLEVDLFENSIHLQSHRRVRALLRFCSLSKTLTKAPSPRSLAQFILPLATRYLCNEKYAGKNAVIDAAISCLGVVCKFLPWHKYQTILRYYLSKFQGKIEYQRQLVRVVIAILDSFHFDISKASQASTATEKKPEVDPQPEDQTEVGESREEEKIHEELNKEDDDGEAEEVETVEKTTGSTLPYSTITILKPTEASRVERAMSGSLLTQLTKAIGQRTQKDDTHKSNFKSLGPDRDQEEVMRIPIAVTLVKLLQKLSTKILDYHLPGILMKLCTFLKSKMESVRRATRETLQQVMASLGTKYLPVVLSEMTSALTKGFQLHVLIYTIHSVIQSIQSQLKPGDIDDNLPALIEVCKTDIFGQPSEEKDVKQILAKHKEVRSTKSYRLMNLIAQHITDKCLTDVLMPVKEVLTTTHSHKAVTKCRECLRHVVLGLCSNEFITPENLFIYVYGVTSESIPSLSAPEGGSEEKKKKNNPKERRDCYIIPEEPKSRTGVKRNAVKKDGKSNLYILSEFGFQLLQFLLKKEKLKSTPNFKSLLDPIGPVLVKAVQSQHVKVSTLALNCLCKVLKYDLPSVRSEVKTIIREMFAILHKYAAPGLTKGETFDLVIVSFKAICVIMRDTNYDGIDSEKLKILLVYVEQDVHDSNRQASAFNLLKTILRKKLNVPELKVLMKKVAELSVTSELAHVRLQARQSAFQYLMDYPLGQDLEFFIGFFISQLSYRVETGRQSALEMIHNFITHFPQEVLNEQCGVFLITLGARLVNDDSPECRKAVSGIVKAMILRLDNVYRDRLFDIVCLWLKKNKLAHRRLASQIAGIFATVEKSELWRRLPGLLPLIRQQFAGNSTPGKFVRLPKNGDEKEAGEDYLFFQVLQLLLKICNHCPKFLTASAHQESVYFFAETCQSLLCHPHEWVRLAAAQFLGSLFNSIDPAVVAKVLNGEKVESDASFLVGTSLRRRFRSLVLDHVSQLILGVEIGEEFIEQVTKNLVYFARVLKDVEKFDATEGDDDGGEEEEEEEEEEGKGTRNATKVSLLWLIRKMRGVVNKEVAETPLSFVLRKGVYKWIGAIGVAFTKEELVKVLYHVIAPIVRERDLVEGETSNSPVKSLVMEVTKVLKAKAGEEEFTKEAVRVRKKLMERRAERRTQRAQEFVTNPERAAKRKMEKQAKKKVLKKRKIEAFKGKGLKRFPRKRKAEDDLFM